MIKRLRNRGDTIIEVLLAMAVVSAVLGGAFVSANRSLTTTRQAQERVESLKLAESQIERLKVAALNPASAVFTTGGYFCLDDSLTIRSLGGGSLDDFTGATYPPECKQAPVGGVTYHLSVRQDPSNVFTVRSRWDRAGGRGIDEVMFVYRVYE